MGALCQRDAPRDEGGREPHVVAGQVLESRDPARGGAASQRPEVPRDLSPPLQLARIGVAGGTREDQGREVVEERARRRGGRREPGRRDGPRREVTERPCDPARRVSGAPVPGRHGTGARRVDGAVQEAADVDRGDAARGRRVEQGERLPDRPHGRALGELPRQRVRQVALGRGDERERELARLAQGTDVVEQAGQRDGR